MSSILEMRVPPRREGIPTRRLVEEFDEFAGPVFDQIGRLTLQNQKLKAARDLLLPRLMNGEIAV